MYAICTHHILVHGLKVFPFYNDNKGIFLQFLVCATLWGVNCFAMISGYAGVDSQFKYKRFIRLWGITLFYSVMITGLFAIFVPDAVTWKSLLYSCFPILTCQYWYVHSYAAMFAMIPLFNAALKQCGKRELVLFLQIFFVLFCLISLIPGWIGRKVLFLNFGYSVFWLSYLYLLGGFWKIYGLHTLFESGFFEYIKIPLKLKNLFNSKKAQMFLFCIMVLTTLVANQIPEFISGYLQQKIVYRRLMGYTSPTILLCAIIVMHCFVGKKLSSISKYIAVLSPMAFSVYLIHDNNLTRIYFVNRILGKFLSDFGEWTQVPLVLLAALLIYAVCSVIDYGRICSLRFIKNIIFKHSTSK